MMKICIDEALNRVDGSMRMMGDESMRDQPETLREKMEKDPYKGYS